MDLEVCVWDGGEWRDGAQSYRRWREIRKTERYEEKKRHWGGERREGEGGMDGGRAGGRGPQLAGAEPEREKRREKFPGVFIS